VLLSGAGEVARNIVCLAQANDVPVQRDDALVGMLSGLPAGAEINEGSFELVAEVLSFLYVTDKEWREEHQFLDTVLVPTISDPEVLATPEAGEE
jgi:flagellar biosynthesis protein